VQLAEVQTDEPSVLTVDYESVAGAKVDDTATTIVTTQIDESQRERSVISRRQGNAWPVPAGRSRVFVELNTALPIRAQIAISPGVAVTETTPGEISPVPPAGTVVFVAPPYARQAHVIALTGTIDVTTDGNTWQQVAATPSMDLWVPAYATLSVSSALGGLVAVSYQITS
jgi:hypothetical protein